ncbi:hypothetical protein Aspvir_007039 [Aspergillus viridinutans]|uniref:Uncharacterized protein n=1 Tax=Aspergillus viridinutans TaxID=75553 RepID=A0A9P3BVG3_ASPVI|nr:uncharacterized protein Aspvir_007039 [Aspergillus viridinutans]GIK02974.1 hypothetical protein Aspvir_007039 [Aspergillus viridinutans]
MRPGKLPSQKKMLTALPKPSMRPVLRSEVSTEEPETNANAMRGFKLLAIFSAASSAALRQIATPSSRSRNRRYRGSRCRKWRLRYRSHRFSREIETTAARHMQQQLHCGSNPSTRHRRRAHGEGYLAVVFLERDQTVIQQIMNLDLIGCAFFIPAIFMLPALDEVMMVCKELLELLPVPARRSGPDHTTAGNSGTGTGPPFTPASVNAGHPDPCDGIGEPTQRGGGPFDPLRINYITVLQVATSYAYALQLLDLAVDNLKTRAGNLALVSLGTFNLASQPAMSTAVGAYMVSSMVHQLRDAISLLTPEYQHQQGPPPPHASSPSPSGLRAAAAAANNSIQAAVDMVSEKETSLLEKLAQVMINS